MSWVFALARTEIRARSKEGSLERIHESSAGKILFRFPSCLATYCGKRARTEIFYVPRDPIDLLASTFLQFWTCRVYMDHLEHFRSFPLSQYFSLSKADIIDVRSATAVSFENKNSRFITKLTYRCTYVYVDSWYMHLLVIIFHIILWLKLAVQ